MKLCKDCGIHKPLGEFQNAKANRDGKRNNCKACDRLYQLRRRENLTPELRAQMYANNRKYQQNSLKGKAVFLLNGIKERCKKNGRENNVTRDFIHGALIAGICAATGFVFRYEKSKRGGITPFSPSVDRINSDGGYTCENVQVVCSMYNVGKGGHSELDFIAMCMAVAEKNRTNYAALMRMQSLRQGDRVL